MKKLLVVILAAALLLGLAACGGGEAEKFTITYDPGSHGSGAVAAGTKTKGQDFTLSSQTFIRDGYTQIGWSTSDGGAKAYDLGGKYMADADIILYPFWEEVWEEDILPGVTIKFGGIDWLVLEVQDGKALILSEKILEKRPYHEREYITWENCSLRGYLNGEFYNNTFSAAEKARIVETAVKNDDNQWYGSAGGNDTLDKIFLLSLEEVVKYFGDSGQLANMPGDLTLGINDQYNSARIAYDKDGNDLNWWLRSPGYADSLYYAYGSLSAAYVRAIYLGSANSDGGMVLVVGLPVYVDYVGVRPALWLNL
ncbi:MAG: InlB B-repeat-containing protein [Clostridiales bacterium]|nr:InlB B-repeat-containing protein [Clostridiales bacterium]